MGKNHVCLAWNDIRRRHLFDSHQDVAVAQVRLDFSAMFSVFLICVATELALFANNFDPGEPLMNLFDLQRGKRNPFVGRRLSFA